MTTEELPPRTRGIAMTTEELIAALRALAADLGRHPGAATATDAADRLEALTAPVEGMETTEKERAWVAKAEQGISLHPFDVPGTVIRVLHDFDRLSSALADLQERVGKARALMLTSPRWALALERAFALLSPEGEAKGKTTPRGGFIDGNDAYVSPGDRVEYRFGGQGTVGEIMHDGDADVTFDDGRVETVKWKNLCKVTQPPRDADPVPAPEAREAAIRSLVHAADRAVHWLHGRDSVTVRTNLKAALDAARSAGITQGAHDV